MVSYDPGHPVDIPADGLERLAQGRQGLIISDLSVHEFLLVRDAGFDPGLVEFFAIGTAVVPMPGAPGIQSPTTVLSLDT
jgi:hypothetical protein